MQLPKVRFFEVAKVAIGVTLPVFREIPTKVATDINASRSLYNLTVAPKTQ